MTVGRAVGRAVGAALGGAVLVACNPPVREVVGVPAPPVVAAGPACAPPPAAALALLADAPCPWVIVPGDRSELTLRSSDMASARSLGIAAPEACAGRCDFTGTVTAIGPLLLATHRDPASELVDAAFVGAALGGEVVRFAPLWFGLAAHGDSTALGPSHALVPWVCGDALVLAVEGRLPAAGAEEPAAALLRAAGMYGPGDDELRRVERPAPALSGCTRVPLELP